MSSTREKVFTLKLRWANDPNLVRGVVQFRMSPDCFDVDGMERMITLLSGQLEHALSPYLEVIYEGGFRVQNEDGLDLVPGDPNYDLAQKGMNAATRRPRMFGSELKVRLDPTMTENEVRLSPQTYSTWFLRMLETMPEELRYGSVIVPKEVIREEFDRQMAEIEENPSVSLPDGPFSIGYTKLGADVRETGSSLDQGRKKE